MGSETGIPRLLGEIAAVADEVGDGDSAKRARDELQAVSAQAARVVVVGEKKRGKSSLINALLRRPGLLPVDSDIATSVHITVFAAESEQAIVVDETHPEGFAVPLADIGEYAALDPQTGEMRHAGVREVSVGLPEPLLRSGLDLIDTPGVGGLVAGHAALTLAALSLADALLFVVNGQSELTDSECEFLKRATDRIATVVFVLAQTDKYPKWRETLAVNQVLIAKHAPRFADSSWFAVSARDRGEAMKATAAGKADRAAQLEQRSGFAALEAELSERIAGHAAELREQNAAFVARRVLDKLTGDQERRRRSLEKDPQLVATVRAKQDALTEATRADASWRRELEASFRKLAKQSSLEYQRGLVDLQVSSDAWVARATTATASQIAHDFDAGLRAVWADVEARTREGALAIAAYIAQSLGTEGVDALDADVPYPEQLASRQLLIGSEPQQGGIRGQLGRLMPNLQGVSLVSMLGHLLFATLNPFAVLAGGGVVAWLLGKNRREQQDHARARAEVQRHIQFVVSQARMEFANALGELIESLQEQLRETIEDRMQKRQAELSAAIVEAKRHLEESEQVLAPQRDACEKMLGRLRALMTRAGALTAIGAGSAAVSGTS